MNFPFFIARRYVFSKKSTNAINVISAISVVGVAVGTMALVIVLSVFNGFHDLVASFFTNFDPQIELVPTQGKTAPADDPLLDKIRKMPQVSVHTDVLEDQGLAVYGDRQQMVTVMGVDDNFTQLTNISDILYGDGEFTLQAANLFYAIPGIRLAQDMGLGARFDGYLKLYAPVRRGQITDLEDPSDGFVGLAHIAGRSVCRQSGKIRPRPHYMLHRFRTPTVRSGRHAVVSTDTAEAGQRPRGCEEADARDCRLEV